MAYYYDENGNLTKKKKKDKDQSKNKQSSSTKSSGYYYDDSGNLTKRSQPEKVDSDVAPVKETKKSEERTWFQSGAYGKLENRFKDGYQFGDVAKTGKDLFLAARASEADFTEKLTSGILGIGEKMVDFGAMIGTAMNQGSLAQSAQGQMLYYTVSGQGEKNDDILKNNQKAQEELEKATADFVAKDLYNEEQVAKKIISEPFENVTGMNVETDSVLGDKSDALVQSAGQLVAQVGADYLLPGSGMLLMGATTFGSEAENAFLNGADYNEALVSATISAGAEMLTEKIGGVKFGGKTLTDAVFGKLSSKMTNKLVKVLVTSGKIGADALAEGGEEILSGYLSAIGQKLTYMKDKEIEELFSKDDKLESFIGGVVLGGTFSGGESLVSGRNAVNGLTKSDQAVVDKVYNDAIAETEKNGKKLTSKEKSKIYDEVSERLEKGDISIDTIEEVLGGKTYEEYKSLTEKEESLKAEISQLEDVPEQQFTIKQRERLTAAREELKNLANKDELKTKLSDEVYGIAQRGKLVESYNERARRGQAFEADLTQYEGKRREAVERAINSGVLNNTYRSHELVDILSKIEADKGIVFDYTNNEKLKETGFAIEGKTVNGFVKDGGVTLNVQSSKAWQSTVGHEISHVLESTEAYGELRQAVFAYAESKGELASRKAALTELYKNMDADIDAELTADLIGDYLFTDKAFVDHLTGNRTLFQKIYDEIKYLCKVATGKELTEIEKVKREFDRAWKEYGKDTVQDAESNEYSDHQVAYSIREEAPPKESKSGVEYDEASESYSPVRYSISSWSESDYVTERQKAAEAMAETLGVDTEKASKYIDDVNSIAKMIADDKTRLDYEASPDRSAFVSNSEYGGSIDFSTICKKRRLFTGTFEAIQNALPNTALTAEEVLEIRKMMKDKGYEVSCGLCYVEGSRANMGQYTKQFIERYKATNPEYVPNMAEMNTATGQEQIRKEHPEVYEAYEYFMNHYGRLSPTDKALFASQQKPKMYQMSTDYKGEILDNFGKKNNAVNEKNKNGGLRLQSFSDFEIIHLIDSMQVIMDMSRVGLAGQAYTKVPDFAWALGDTGLKINLSLIAKGVDENGRLVLDEVEGMSEADAMALRDRYSDNVGTILVAFNDEQLKAAMADERIDYIIPYHRSQWKTNQYEAMGLPENTKDYTNLQNESYIEPVYNKNGKKQRPSNYMPNNYWDFGKSGKENAEAYLKMCAENNRKPKFSHLLVDNHDGSYSLQPDGSTDGYWKTLIDFKMYNNDGVGVPQNPVTPDFNMEEAQRMLNEYTGGHQKFPVAKDIVEEFVSKHPDNIAPVDVKYSISEDADAPLSASERNMNTMSSQDLFLDIARISLDIEKLERDIRLSEYVDNKHLERRLSVAKEKYVEYGEFLLANHDKFTLEQHHLLGRALNIASGFSMPKTYTIEQFEKDLKARVDEYNQTLDKSFVENLNDEDKKLYTFLDLMAKFFGETDNENVQSDTGVKEDGWLIDESELPFSLSNEGEEHAPTGNFSTPMKELALEDVAPVGENAPTTDAPMQGETPNNVGATPKSERIADGTRSDELLYESLDNYPMKTIEQKIAEKIRAVQGEIADKKDLRKESWDNYEKQIADLRAKYNSKKNKNTKEASKILESISRLERLKASREADLAKRISDLEARVEKMHDPSYARGMYAHAKMEADAKWAADLLGDTSTWVDKKIGLQYATNTERRNLRDIVRDENGNVDIAHADRIDDALNGQYNREQAAKNKELAEVRGKYAKMKITKAEDAYIQMLGEFRHNPETTLTEQDIKEYYEKNKRKIDEAKVDRIIEMVRQDYDEFLERINAELKKQGKKEIPYRRGYFPHFTEPKQNFIQRLLNWKTQDNEIPTSIAGLTETFRPTKSWQSFDKTRHSDKTDYSFMKGFDSYSEGALDWIYHMDTLQKRRAVENHIRFTHSDEGVKARIKEVYANKEIDADEKQAQIEHILSESKNPLNNFIQDFTTHTNILAGKKNSLDRTVEQWTNRHIYSVMSNVQNRVSANMVLANVRSALTNFIPITQSWAQVSPAQTLNAAKETIANSFKDDGTIDKSTFLTNRLREADKLYKTNWDKVLDTAGVMFEIVDNFSSQVIWRSKYNQNLKNGMSENEAIKNADQFAENVMAGRSKGNEPTIFNAKNPFVKAFTMFQLEVNNQYGYLLKDVPNDLKAETKHWKFNLAKGYTTAFVGAYIYNALLEQVTGSDAALDPIGIVEDLLRDLGLFDDDEEKEGTEVATNLFDNVVEELPFVGGLFGGGRIPISSAMPYGGEYGGGVKGFIEDVGNIGDGGLKNIGKEMMNPVLNVVSPVAGGQIKKTAQGLNMFSDEHPVAGSYTDSGNLRFPVEDTLGNRIQAGIFGQYASENAREYFDNDYAPLKEKQIQEYIDVDIPIKDYREYREGLSGLKTLNEKGDYIGGLDLPVSKKNILINNIADRSKPIDMTGYENYPSFEEFDFATRYPDIYSVLQEQGISVKDYKENYEETAFMRTDDFSWAANNPEKYTVSKAVTGDVAKYKQYTTDLYNIKADKDANGKSINGSRKEKVLDYINNLDIDYGARLILYKSEYPSDDTYNVEIIEYINGRTDISDDEKLTIYTELGFRVANGYVYWD